MASSYRRLNQFVSIGLSAVCGGLATYYGFTNRLLTVDNEQEYYTIFENRESKWDFNWDRRDPKSLVKPVDPSNSKLQNEFNQKVENNKSHATRHIFLIRHGQYNLKGETDEERKLTELGRRQAMLTGERLSQLNFPWTNITQSTMTRAMETCSLIQKYLPANLPLKSSDLLREGAPVPPDPPSKHWKPELYQFYRDGARIESGFRAFIHRAPPKQNEDSYEIIVCHANVIRYFVMRTLQLTPEAWLRLSMDHASITWLSIFPNGRVALRCYSNSGYMPPDAISS